MASPRRVAFLGMGIMGSRMAANVSRAGYERACLFEAISSSSSTSDPLRRGRGARPGDDDFAAARRLRRANGG